MGQDRQRTALRDILASAKGFTDTSDQDRYDDCEMAISRVVREIRSVANTWKVRTRRILGLRSWLIMLIVANSP